MRIFSFLGGMELRGGLGNVWELSWVVEEW